MTISERLAARPPREASARMGDLATLPVFLKLGGKVALVAGGSGGTAWKAELLAAAGAHVNLVWEEPDHEALKLAQEWPDRVTLHRPHAPAGRLQGVAVAIGALEDEAEGAAFAAAARARACPSTWSTGPPSATSSSAPSSTVRRS